MPASAKLLPPMQASLSSANSAIINLLYSRNRQMCCSRRGGSRSKTEWDGRRRRLSALEIAADARALYGRRNVRTADRGAKDRLSGTSCCRRRRSPSIVHIRRRCGVAAAMRHNMMKENWASFFFFFCSRRRLRALCRIKEICCCFYRISCSTPILFFHHQWH